MIKKRTTSGDGSKCRGCHEDRASLKEAGRLYPVNIQWDTAAEPTFLLGRCTTCFAKVPPDQVDVAAEKVRDFIQADPATYGVNGKRHMIALRQRGTAHTITVQLVFSSAKKLSEYRMRAAKEKKTVSQIANEDMRALNVL